MRILIDTNVLVRWSHDRDPFHPFAVMALHILHGQGVTPAITPQNLIEFWAVVTRPASANGLGYSPIQADQAIGQIIRAFAVLPDHPAIFDEWRRLVVAHSVRGKKVHDARLVAAMYVHGVDRILTFNGSDFARYPGIVAVDPRAVAPSP